MESKRERGWERQVLVLGADHHGYVARLKAAFQALGGDPQMLEPLIMQLVHLIENDSRTKMSKRRGEFVTLDELLDEIGVDATRYFMLQSSHDRTLDLNLDLAKSQSADNPVYYVQYAHARIASMLNRLGDARVGLAVSAGADWSSPAGELHPSERELIKKLLSLPEEIADAANAPGAAPDRGLRARAGAGVHGVLPRLQGRRSGTGGDRVVPDRAVRGDQDAAGPGARAARGQRARLDVSRRSAPT